MVLSKQIGKSKFILVDVCLLFTKESDETILIVPLLIINDGIDRQNEGHTRPFSVSISTHNIPVVINHSFNVLRMLRVRWLYVVKGV